MLNWKYALITAFFVAVIILCILGAFGYFSGNPA
jgi:hypothetical protein